MSDETKTDGTEAETETEAAATTEAVSDESAAPEGADAPDEAPAGGPGASASSFAKRGSAAETSAYRACIGCFEDLETAMSGINVSRRDPELVHLLEEWRKAAPSIRARYDRLAAMAEPEAEAEPEAA